MGLTIPRVHLNGTSKDELLLQARNVVQALNAALDALRDAGPHGRDYYPLDTPGAPPVLYRAQDERIEVLTQLALIKAAFVELYEKIEEQGS